MKKGIVLKRNILSVLAMTAVVVTVTTGCGNGVGNNGIEISQQNTGESDIEEADINDSESDVKKAQNDMETSDNVANDSGNMSESAGDYSISSGANISLPRGYVINTDDAVYMRSDKAIIRYENGSSKDSYVYQVDDDMNCNIVDYDVDGDDVYILVNEEDTYTSHIIKAGPNGTIEILTLDPSSYYYQLNYYNNKLYLTTNDENYKSCEYMYDLAETDKELEECPAYAALNTEYDSVSSYSSGTFTYSYELENMGRVVMTDSDDKIYTADLEQDGSVGEIKLVNSDDLGYAVFLGTDYIITKYPGDQDFIYYAVNLDSGEATELATIHKPTTDFAEDDPQLYGVSDPSCYEIAMDSENLYILQVDDNKKTYDMVAYALDGSAQNVIWSDKKNRIYNKSYVEECCFYDYNGCIGMCGDGFIYARATDIYNAETFMRSPSDSYEEHQVGTLPFMTTDNLGSGINVVDACKDYYSTDGNILLYEYRSVYPVFDEAIGANSDAIAKMNSMFEDIAQNGLTAAQKEADDVESIIYNGDAPGGLPYSDTFVFKDIVFQNDDYICISIYSYYYEGGAHGMGNTAYYTFDKATGEELEIRDVVNNSDEEIGEIIYKYLKEAYDAEPEMYFDDAPETYKEYYTGTEYVNWFLSDNGIGIQFSEYEVAPYASGTPTIYIPYSDLDLKINIYD